MSNKLEEILTDSKNTENFKEKFLDFLEEDNRDLKSHRAKI